MKHTDEANIKSYASGENPGFRPPDAATDSLVRVPRHAMRVVVSTFEADIKSLHTRIAEMEAERNDLINRLGEVQKQIDAQVVQRENLSWHLRNLTAGVEGL